jgi:hypothetical protein
MTATASDSSRPLVKQIEAMAAAAAAQQAAALETERKLLFRWGLAACVPDRLQPCSDAVMLWLLLLLRPQAGPPGAAACGVLLTRAMACTAWQASHTGALHRVPAAAACLQPPASCQATPTHVTHVRQHAPPPMPTPALHPATQVPPTHMPLPKQGPHQASSLQAESSGGYGSSSHGRRARSSRARGSS